MPVKKFKRATALLELNRGRTFTEVAEIIGVTHQTTARWAKKYQDIGLEFLTDKLRPRCPTLIDGLKRAKITALVGE